MTKKILALALAGTTAFSVFAGALSVSAVYDDSYKAYTPVTLAKDGSTDAFANVSNVKDFAGMFNFDGTDQVIEASNGSVVYLFDYTRKTGTGDTELDALKKSIADAQGESTTETAASLYGKFMAAYDSLTYESATTIGAGATKARADAIHELNNIYNDNIKKYTAADSVDGTTISVNELSATYDSEDVEGYNLKALFDAIVTAATDNANTPTSQALYLTQEYKRIVGDGLLNGADTTSVIDEYDELYAKLSERIADDYSSTNWRNFQRLLADAEELAEKATTISDWTKALNKLKEANNVAAEAGKYTDLQAALTDLYVDGKVSSIDATYPRTNATKAVYLVSDYQETDKYGRKTASAAYEAAFIDTNQDSAYKKAYDVWNQARKYGAKVPQSDIDNALTELESAIAALDPTSSAPNYQMVLLETAVENVSGYVDTDYNATSRKYKDFVAALEKAEEVLSKANPAASEVTSAYTKLATTASDLASVTRTISSALKKELQNAINQANVTLKEISAKQGAQYAALQEAIAFANAVKNGVTLPNDSWNADDINDYKFKTKSTISDFETAITELEKAITGFNQAQGWYTTAEGKWMYGEGDGYYVDGWKKIGNFWFFFNADGTAKQNEWFQDGSNWYYCGNSCVAYSGWGKVDGSWYYFSKANVMCTGWIRPSNSYYYLDPTSGKMVTGWAQIGGKWYYFSTDSNNLGAMLTSTTTPDGYQVGADGAMI